MLTPTQLRAIKLLQQQCEQFDSIELKLNWELLNERKNTSHDFFVWQEDELIAYLALYEFGTTVEVCGMVKPSERRKGYFSKLWKEAQQGIQQTTGQVILLNAPGASESAKGWLAVQPCTYDFSEFNMQWQEKTLSEKMDIAMRLSQPKDRSFEVALDAEAFSLSIEDAEAYYQERLSKSKERRYIIEVEGKAVGKIRATRSPGESYISGFAIVPELRGKGYGGQALQWVVQQEQSTGNTICLDVETKNTHALKLYEQFGFVQKQRQDYYLFS